MHISVGEVKGTNYPDVGTKLGERALKRAQSPNMVEIASIFCHAGKNCTKDRFELVSHCFCTTNACFGLEKRFSEGRTNLQTFVRRRAL